MLTSPEAKSRYPPPPPPIQPLPPEQPPKTLRGQHRRLGFALGEGGVGPATGRSSDRIADERGGRHVDARYWVAPAARLQLAPSLSPSLLLLLLLRGGGGGPEEKRFGSSQ
ncbi:hypothetical protein NL676_005886 [Syzygium grande]|nr:hypothetical protein NL676_005886 [Syzygium grande]